MCVWIAPAGGALRQRYMTMTRFEAQKSAFAPSYSIQMKSMHIDLSAGVHSTGEGQTGGFF